MKHHSHINLIKIRISLIKLLLKNYNKLYDTGCITKLMYLISEIQNINSKPI